MAHIHSIKKLLNIKDPNIILNENSVKIEKKDGVECAFIDGKLTYQPIGCTVCGVKNESDLNYTNYSSHRLFEGLMTEKMIVDYMIQLDPRLERVYSLFNQLKWALERRDFDHFSKYLEESKKYTLPRKARTVLQTFESFKDSIENAFIYTLSNGPIEGINNKIKNIKRSGYGYRNFYNLRARLLITYRLTKNTFKPRPLYFKDEKVA